MMYLCISISIVDIVVCFRLFGGWVCNPPLTPNNDIFWFHEIINKDVNIHK